MESFPSYSATDNPTNSVVITIEPAGIGRTQTEDKIPLERMKTIYAFLLATFSIFLNDLTLSYINELYPVAKPLPDVVFDHTPYLPWALLVSEWILLASGLVFLILAMAHRYRWIVFRRFFIIVFLLALARCATMFLTQVPIADARNKYCAPKLAPEERTFWRIFKRAFETFFWQGIQVFNGGNMHNTLCGDYIFSGHSAALITCYLFIQDYSPRAWWPLHHCSLVASTIGVAAIVLARGHYSLDVLIAYWITTRTFWVYHILANCSKLRKNVDDFNYLTKFIWFPLFYWMEGKIQRPLPRNFNCPLPFGVCKCFICRCRNNRVEGEARN